MSMDDNAYDNFGDEAPPPEEGNNRTFLIAAGILGGIVLLSVACLAGYALLIAPRQQQASQVAANATQTAEAANAFINQALTATADAMSIPSATSTPTATATSVVAVATNTNTPDPSQQVTTPGGTTPQAATATVAAALTQAAAAQLTVVPTSTALPKTGFVDDFGVPGLVIMALAFIIVIMMARRLRTAPVRVR